MVKKLNKRGKRLYWLKISAVSTAYALVLVAGVATCAFADASWKQLLNEGEMELGRQNLPAAERLLKQASLQLDSQPALVEQRVGCLQKLAATLALENKTTAAEGVYQKCLQVLETAYGKSHPEVAHTLLALGSIFEAEGDHSSAMQLYQRALEITEQGLGPLDPAVVTDMQDAQAQYGLLQEKPVNSPPPVSLSQQPSLEASDKLLRQLAGYDRDLLDADGNSDASLLSLFQQTLSTANREDKAYARMLSNSPKRYVHTPPKM